MSAHVGLRRPLPPAIVVAVYCGSGFGHGEPLSRPDIETLRADAADGDLAVMAHVWPTPRDVPPMRDLQRLGVRTWLGLPSNPLSAQGRSSRESVLHTVREHAKWARDQGVECFMFNGERGRDRSKDWVIDTPEEREYIAWLSKALPEAARAVLGDEVAIAFTSHDMPQWFALAWDVLLGESSEVDYHAPQHYPADPDTPGLEPFSTAVRRVTSSQTRWTRLANERVIDPRFAPGGGGYAPYGQIHGLTPAAAAHVLDEGDTSCAWALPRIPKGRADEDGVLGLRAVLRARKLTGRTRGAILRAQAGLGLKVDGNAGAETLAGLGLTQPPR